MEVLQKESVQRDYELRILRFCRNELTFLLLFYVLNFRNVLSWCLQTLRVQSVALGTSRIDLPISGFKAALSQNALP